jgi:hypothetical protein
MRRHDGQRQGRHSCVSTGPAAHAAGLCIAATALVHMMKPMIMMRMCSVAARRPFVAVRDLLRPSILAFILDLSLRVSAVVVVTRTPPNSEE